MSLEGKVALVTGASSGLGKDATIRLAAEGAVVGLIARRLEKLKEDVACAIEAVGGSYEIICADVTSAEDTERAIKAFADKHGRIDILVVNAGTNGKWAPVEELELADWEKTMSVNLHGAFHTVRFGVPYMMKSGGSIIVNASINGTYTFRNSGASIYGTSKGALVGWSRAIALELAKYKIRVNAVCPGKLESEIHEKTESQHLDQIQLPAKYDLGNIPLCAGQGNCPSGKPFADIVAFLSGSEAEHITGAVIPVDGGQSLFA